MKLCVVIYHEDFMLVKEVAEKQKSDLFLWADVLEFTILFLGLNYNKHKTVQNKITVPALSGRFNYLLCFYGICIIQSC